MDDSLSPKNDRELAEKAQELEVQLQKIGRVLYVPWAARSFCTIKAVWNSFRTLKSHFSTASQDATGDAKERSKYKGLKFD